MRRGQQEGDCYRAEDETGGLEKRREREELKLTHLLHGLLDSLAGLAIRVPGNTCWSQGLRQTDMWEEI